MVAKAAARQAVNSPEHGMLSVAVLALEYFRDV